jgi:hypothetical protein
MKILTFPFHPPYQINLFKLPIKFFLIDGFINSYWNYNQNTSIGGNYRPLPTNVELIRYENNKQMLEIAEKVDMIILPTYEHINALQTLFSKLPTIYCHATIFRYPGKILPKSKTLYFTTSSMLKLDVYRNEFKDNKFEYIIQGHDDTEFNYDIYKKRTQEIIFPINKFKDSFPERIVSGYSNTSLDIIKQYDIRVLGNNNSPQLGLTETSYEDYIKTVTSADIGVQFSPYKGRAFTTCEMMLGGTPVLSLYENNLIDPEVSTPIIDKENGFIAKDLMDFHRLIRNWKKNISETQKSIIRENARHMIIDKFPLNIFLDRWWEIIVEESMK